MAGERQSGDGQVRSMVPSSGQKLDDDEDRKNPAYIPRKGLFFEHDVRGHAQEEERYAQNRNRKLWKDEGRWEHDRFREEEQAPKSREELIAIYGYDIRNGGGSGERSYRQPLRRRTVPPAGGRDAPVVIESIRRRPRRAGPSAGPTPPSESAPPRPASSGSRSSDAAVRGPLPLSPPLSRPPQRPVGKPLPPPRRPVGAQVLLAGPQDSLPARGPGQANSRPWRIPRRAALPPPATREGRPGAAPLRAWSRRREAGALTELEQDVARISLAGQAWSQSPTSYIRSEMRGEIRPPPQFSNMEEMGVSSSRAKRYSSQRQRAVPEPTPPLHLGVMEGHYYEPVISYQGPSMPTGRAPPPIPPQGMLVQPEMHSPTPVSPRPAAPIADPALYGGPAVSLSPGQPQATAAPRRFYPPPGVMTFPYPTMYPSPQVSLGSARRRFGLGVGGQAQVTFGGVTYYDTMQQQAQPKPSPPRRTSQPSPPPPQPYCDWTNCR
uniref:Protein CASC3 n=1 Tax=Takifugu rubripes TaxID=31033 RepID=A0A674P2V4_TAKRU